MSSPCCGCVQLGTGVRIIGAFITVVTAIQVFSTLSEFGMDTGATQEIFRMLGVNITKEELQGMMIYALLRNIAEILDGIILIMAAVKKNATLCSAGMFFFVALTLADIVYSIYFIIKIPVFILILFAIIAYRSYFIWVIYAFKVELDEGGGDNVVNQQVNPVLIRNSNYNYNNVQPGVQPHYSRNPVQYQAPPTYYSGNPTQNQDYPSTAPNPVVVA